MSLTVRHISAGTMCPFAGPLVGIPKEMVCHCLVVETDHGLVLVDTGMGTADLADRRGRLGGAFTTVVRPRPDPATTALHQLEAMGHKASDVRHIVLTHMDLDHAGGLPDFPAAKVHVLDPEFHAAHKPTGHAHRMRYKPAHWAHEPDWHLHPTEGEDWFGFEAVRALDPAEPDLLMVPLAGHSPGHAAVAVRRAEGWLLHCGDAYFHHGEVDPVNPSCPVGLRIFQRLVEADHATRVRNQQRLLELNRDHGDQITFACAHDPLELERLRAGAAGSSGHA